MDSNPLFPCSLTELEIENTISREQKFWQPVFCHELLQFANESSPYPVPPADLCKASCIKTIAWVLQYVVPHVTVRPKKVLAQLWDNAAIESYVTVSDLAFAFVVLEHGLRTWRAEAHYRLESGGTTPLVPFAKPVVDGLYRDGIAGKQAKERYHALCQFFFRNFFSNAHGVEVSRNMDRLQYILNQGVCSDDKHFQDEIDGASPHNEEWGQFSGIDLGQEIVHQMFYYNDSQKRRMFPGSVQCSNTDQTAFASPGGETSLKLWAKLPLAASD